MSDSSEGESIEEEMTETGPPIQCLFCEDTAPYMEEMLQHLETKHNFKTKEFFSKVIRDTYDQIKLVTYIRRAGPSAQDLEGTLESRPWASEEYLRPVDGEDPWLWTHFDFLPDLDSEDPEPEEPKYVNSENGLITLAKEHFTQLQVNLAESNRLLAEKDSQIEKLKSLLSQGDQPSERTPGYYASYAHHDIHREMLSDKARMDAFKGLFSNKDFFRNKTVLDLGCGTGILSMMAATAGAKSVVGVDNSEILYTAIEIVKENSFENEISLIKTDVEHLQLDQRFDVIISEWMGYFLLYENMLPSLLHARDKFLAKGGHVFPSRYSIHLVGVSDADGHAERTRKGYAGYKMSPLYRSAISEPTVETVDPGLLVTEPTCVFNFDVLEQNENGFSSKFTLLSKSNCDLTGLCGYFDCSFEPASTGLLTTSPASPPTHWKQTVFYFESPIAVTEGEQICGEISVAQNEGERGLTVKMALKGHSQIFVME